MKLIVLSPFLYYPGVPNGGGALCWGQLEGLAKQHEIHFLSFTQPGTNEYEIAAPHLLSRCATLTTVNQHLTRLKIVRSKFKLFSHLEPIVASLCKSDEMTATLKALIAKVKPDVVFIQFPQMAQYVADCVGSATVMDVQDAFSVSAYRRFKAAMRMPKMAIEFLLWLSWLRYESHWYSRFSVTTTLTQQDRAGLEIFSPGLSAIVSPAAVAIPEHNWTATGKNTIAFIGSFSHLPNVQAVLFFIHQIFPIVLAAVPDAVFLVAGKGATPEMEALASENIRFVGTVPDAFDFLRLASVVVVPLKSGGGIKIKTLEALASGCPIVASSIGAEETNTQSGSHILVADTPAEFARAVLSVLGDASLAQRLGENGREHVREKFSWHAKWLSLSSLLELAINRQKTKPEDITKAMHQ